MSPLDFVVIALAAGAVVDVWRNGGLFAEFRNYCDLRADSDPSDAPVADSLDTYPPGPTPRWMKVADKLLPRFVAELLSCWFCFSYHAPWLVIAVLYVPSLFVPPPWHWIALVPLYSLAATRAGNILNAWLPTDAQYETDIQEEFDDDGSTDGDGGDTDNAASPE